MNIMSTSPKTPSIQELRAARGAAKPSFARRFRGWLIATALLVGLIAFAFLGLPPIVKARALQELSTRLGREVTIEKIRINPLVLSVSIEGLAIAEADKASGEFLGWKRVYVNLDSWSLVRGGIGFSEISVNGFRAHVAKGKNGGLSFDDIIAKLTAPDPSAPPAAPKDPKSKAPAVSIGKLAVTDAMISFDDASLERPFATVLGPLTFSLENFRTVGDPDSPYQFEAVTGAGERLAWKGTVSIDPVKSQGELAVTNLDLARLAPYYHTFVPGELHSALADFSGKYTLTLAGGVPALTLADGAFTLRDVRFGEPRTVTDAFTLKRLAVTGVSADSVARKAAITRIAIEGVAVKAVRDAAGIDLVRLITPQVPAHPSSPAPAATASTGGPAPSFTLGELSVSGAQVDLIDRTTTRPAQHRIDDIKFTVRDLDSTKLAHALPFELTVLLPQEGRLQVSGTATPQPLAAKLSLELANVPFSNASPYVEPFLNIRLADGALRAKGDATLENGVVTYTGDFGVNRFSAVDGKLAQDFLKFTSLGVSGIQLTSEPLALAIEEIKLVDPSVAVRIERDGSLSIANALAPAASPAPAAPQADAPATVTFNPAAASAATSEASAKEGPVPPITIGRVVLQNGAFRYADTSITPNARAALTDFNGTITGLSSAAPARADVDIRGKVDGSAPVAITGKLNPLGNPASSDIKIAFKNIDLQPGAGPYVGKFAGYELARGSLNVDVDFKLQDRAINSTNVVTLDQFFLGAKTNSPDATKLPVGLALALLRDNSGKIVIDMPVKGSLDDPNFKIGRVVLRVIGNVLVKAATSPFSLLGAAFGGGGDELAFQEFTAGAATLDEADIKKLETVAKALTARPALNLDLEGAYDPAADLAALRLVQLEQQIRTTAWETRRLVDPNTPAPEALEITPELRAGMIAKLHAAAFPAPAASEAPAIAPDAASTPIDAPKTPAPAPVVAKAVERPSPFAPGLKPRPPRNVGRLPTYAPSSTPKPRPSAALAVTAPPPGPAVNSSTGTPAEASVSAPALAASLLSPAEMEATLAAAITLPDESLRALAEARAQAARTWLVEQGKVPAERVFLTAPTTKGTRVQLNLR
jgi:hypothetical protein